jgi:hypothetical protein
MVEYTSNEVGYTFKELVIVIKAGWGVFCRYPLLNTKSVHALGVDFLYGKRTEERLNIEEYFTKMLLRPEVNNGIKYSILAYLKSPDAVVSKKAKTQISLFEADSKNSNIVARVNERLGFCNF